MQAHEDILISPTGQIAQRIPMASLNDRMDPEHKWISFTWPSSQLTASLLTDADVEGWDVVFTKESAEERDGTD